MVVFLRVIHLDPFGSEGLYGAGRATNDMCKRASVCVCSSVRVCV